MIPWELIDDVQIPGGGRLTLNRRGEEYSIRCDGHELMNSRQHASEEDLARLGCEGLGEGRPPAVLIGGLGMGFTLAATLKAVPPESRVLVAEIVPALIDWNRGPLAHLNGEALDDPRVTVQAVDVIPLLQKAQDEFDAVLLDVDNGPEAMATPTNEWLYTGGGLGSIRSALRRPGRLAIWSVNSNSDFVKLIERTKYDVVQHRPRARGTKGPRHFVWVATPNDSKASAARRPRGKR